MIDDRSPGTLENTTEADGQRSLRPAGHRDPSERWDENRLFWAFFGKITVGYFMGKN